MLYPSPVTFIDFPDVYSSYSICVSIIPTSDASIFSSNFCDSTSCVLLSVFCGFIISVSEFLFTITDTAFDKSPFETIIVAVPVLFAVTTPPSDIEATELSVDLNEIPCSASAGDTDTLSLNASPCFNTR